MAEAVALARAYPSVFGAPVLTAVDPRIFRLRYFTHCMACGFCKDQCCTYGVDIDIENMARLMALDGLAGKIATPPARWFRNEIETDPEFPGGRNGRTAQVDGACVFRAPGGRGCAIHAHCLDAGLDYHHYKPMVSVLFPLTFEHGVLMPSSEVLDGSLVCAGDGPSLYDGVRGELRYYFGDGFIEELDPIRQAASN
ncbi:MAG TPA: hypothetical protein VMH86_09165 [Rhizomicrobium sp.]|nr:hypothetical protein [Rhizomicrobium sp.]